MRNILLPEIFSEYSDSAKKNDFSVFDLSEKLSATEKIQATPGLRCQNSPKCLGAIYLKRKSFLGVFIYDNAPVEITAFYTTEVKIIGQNTAKKVKKSKLFLKFFIMK